MPLFRKVEYPPLLPLGMHEKTMPEVRQLCCTNFSSSRTRDKIMTGLEYVVGSLRRVTVICDVWVNGSFMTEKINPKDSDILLHVQGDFYDNAATKQ